MNKFFISDMHFGHSNIIKYENRPFIDVESMDNTIINNWNKHIKKNDMVYILGDVSFYNKAKTAEIIEQLNGRKFLILGNHDKKNHFNKEQFELISQYPIIIENFYILSHKPVFVNENMPYLNIHGHLHSKKMIGQYFNVSVECIDYTPIDLKTLKRYK